MKSLSGSLREKADVILWYIILESLTQIMRLPKRFFKKEKSCLNQTRYPAS